MFRATNIAHRKRLRKYIFDKRSLVHISAVYDIVLHQNMPYLQSEPMSASDNNYPTSTDNQSLELCIFGPDAWRAGDIQIIIIGEIYFIGPIRPIHGTPTGPNYTDNVIGSS